MPYLSVCQYNYIYIIKSLSSDMSLQLSFTLRIAQYPEDMNGNCCYRNNK